MIAKASTVRALRERVAELELALADKTIQVVNERELHARRERELLQTQADERTAWAAAAAEERASLIQSIVMAAQRPELAPVPAWPEGSVAPRMFATEDDEIREAREAAADAIQAELDARLKLGLQAAPPQTMPGVERQAAAVEA